MQALAWLDYTFASAPIWAWLLFLTVVIALMVFDLGVLNKTDHEIEIKESLWLSAGYIAIALLFGGWIWWQFGESSAIDYYTGFLVEKSLSMDNVFVFALIFGFLKIPRIYQYRVLVWGIIAALILRAIFIGAGAALIAQFSWILWFFGAFLLITGVKMLFTKENDNQSFADNPLLKWMNRHMKITQEFHGNRFWVTLIDPKTSKLTRFYTPLFVALILVNAADIIFAVDSVPAIFAITQDPFIVYTSNIFAILGLRALYFALAAMIHRFHYLKYALALILILVGAKIILMMLGIKIPAVIALGMTLAILIGGIVYSLWRTKTDDANRSDLATN